MWRIASLPVTRRLPARFAAVAVGSARLTPVRWSSSSSSSSDSSPPQGTAPFHSGAVAPAPCSASSLSPSASTAGMPGALPLEGQLRGLSEEDQKLILDALRDPDAQRSSVMGGGGIGPRDADMVAAFTCGQCDYRMVKRFSKHAYTKGIVIVQCPGCQAKHLLADNLGWIEDEATNVEDFLREKGESFVHLGGGDYVMQPPDSSA